MIAAALVEQAHAQVAVPSSTTTVNLQTLSPGSASFSAGSGSVVNVNSGSGVAGDNSQDWQLSNYGSITTSSMGLVGGVELNSASPNAAVLNNYGGIAAVGTGNPSSGVLLFNGGTVNNHAGAVISSTDFYGIGIGAGVLTVFNDGQISGSSSGIRMAGGSVTQSQTGSISSSNGAGVVNDSGALTLSNAGSISGASIAGVVARGTTTGTITNSGTISGRVGVSVETSGVAVTNTGTITGTAGTAVAISGSNNTLTLGTGSVLNGKATVSSGAGNSLVLQGSGATGNALTGFDRFTMAGAQWLVSGTVTTTGAFSDATTVQSGNLVLTGTLNNNGSGGGVTINPGATLQIGNGGTSGNLSFAGFTSYVTNNGALVFNRSDDFAFGITVLGSGTLSQNGTGSLFITNNIIDGGVTTINAGALSIGNGVYDGSVATDIVDNSVLIFNRSGIQYGSVISGTGALQKLGASTLTLSGSNTYTGGTTIGAGTLQLGTGSTSGSIVGDVINNGTLVFNRSDAVTFGGVISGTGGVSQIGTGTATLSGSNSYSGGTLIQGGTVSVGADNNLGDPSGAVTLNGGTLLLSAGFNSSRSVLLDGAGGTFNVAGTNAFAGPITGAGGLTKAGSGTLIINSVADYVGPTSLTAGTLVVGDSTHPNAQLTHSDVGVAVGAAFGGYGSVAGTVNNAGTLGVGNALAALADQPDASFTVGHLVNSGAVTLVNGDAVDRLNVTGAYVSSGGSLALDAVLNEGGAAAQSDRLIANAVQLAGSPTRITVHSLGGSGAVTQGDGIPLVNVLDRTMSAAGAFKLAGRVVSGPYEYMLYQGGAADPSDGQWYLRDTASPTPPTPPNPPTPPTPPGPPDPNPPTPPGPPGPTPPVPPNPPAPLVPIFRPEVGAYLANRQQVAGLLMQTLHDRQGDSQYGSATASDPDTAMGKVWVRLLDDSGHTEGANGLLGAQGGRSLLQIGGDVGQWNVFNSEDSLHLGGMLGRGNTNADVTARFNPAKASGSAHGNLAGFYATWFANSEQRLGSYVDAWAQYGRFDNVVRSDLVPSIDYHSRTWAASLEYGYGFGLGSHWALEPEAQVVYSGYSADHLTDSHGTQIRTPDDDATLGRLGLRLYPQLTSGYALIPFAELNWWHGGGSDKVAFNGVAVSDGVPDNRYQLNLGFQGRIAEGWVMWARIGEERGSNAYKRAEAQVALRYSW